jgi:hypothetical protein
MSKITVKMVRKIAAADGLDHAEFCVEQTRNQDTAPLMAEIARLRDVAYAENEASLADYDLPIGDYLHSDDC